MPPHSFDSPFEAGCYLIMAGGMAAYLIAVNALTKGPNTPPRRIPTLGSAAPDFCLPGSVHPTPSAVPGSHPNTPLDRDLDP
eukprot:CAMPEP_0113951724 /NCGR_PEP_ID=MMETSP1339-20121228/87565_1 /TAXON_ID=94617 /ORGANISM="Fibrocapsa japonica" /LENGTH=81 /DNA_ID=CAMNT_0000960061 /DNA_START=136 /DNA_END=381 /DNA_ORIENTATION=+ /assembly_acc=CAM_ASM_000762